MADTLDLAHRDPKNLNGHLGCTFEEVLGEPDGTHSIDCLWRNAYCCFNGGLNCCYKFLTTICGLCIGLYWGCVYACLAFDHIWCLTPCLKCFVIYMNTCKFYWKACIECALEPVCTVVGLCGGHYRLYQQK